MTNKTLITFASKYGSTEEIAQKIHAQLFNKGFENDLVSITGITDISGYQNIILGVSLYMGSWKKEAVKFLKKFEKELLAKKVWIFCSGPTGVGDAMELIEGKVMSPKMAKRLKKMGVKEVKLFHGNVNVDKLNSFEKWIMKKIKANTGDYRDWSEIYDWTERKSLEMM